MTADVSPRGRACIFLKPDDLRCEAYAIEGQSFCIAHASLDVRKIASEKMSATKRLRHRPTSVKEVLEGNRWDMRTIGQLMKLLMKEVHSGAVPTNVAQAMTSLGHIAIKAVEKGQYEERLDRLEKLAAKEGARNGK